MKTWPKFIIAAIISLTCLFSLPAAAVAQTLPEDTSQGQTTDQQNAQQVIQSGLCAGANLKLEDGNCHDTSENGTDQINKIVHSLINTLSLIVGVVAVIMIIVGGLRYITSGGSDTSVTSAKNTILYAIVGLVIVALSQVMVRFVLNKITQ